MIDNSKKVESQIIIKTGLNVIMNKEIQINKRKILNPILKIVVSTKYKGKRF